MLLSLVLVLGVALAALWYWRAEVARVALQRVLADQGLGPVGLRLDVVEPGLVVARDVRLRGGALRLDTLEVTFDVADVMTASVDSVALRGLRLAIEQGEKGLMVGGRPLIEEAASDPAAEAGGPVLGGLAIGALTLDDVTVVLHRAEGDITARLSTSAAIGDDRVVGGAVKAEVSGMIVGAARSLDLTAGGMTLDLQPGGGAKLGLTAAAVTVAGLPWALDGADLDLGAEGGTITVQLAGGRLRNLQVPERLVPVRLSASAVMKDETLAFEAQARAIAIDGVGADLGGRYDLAKAEGTVRIATLPLKFAAKGLQPKDIAPSLDLPLKAVTGTVSLNGDVAMTGGKLTSSLDLSLADVGFAMDVAAVSDLDMVLRITRPWPLATAARQRISATVASAGESARVEFQGRVRDPTHLGVDRLKIGVAGGSLTALSFEVDLATPAMAATVDVADVDLGEVTRILGVSGLGGSGTLAGRVPLTVRGDEVTIGASRLAAAGPGTIYYRPDDLPPQIAQAGEEMDLVMRALTDFRYQSLAIDFEKAAGGEGFVLLALSGANPSVMNNQPFNLNIRLESNFARLAELVLLGLRSTQDLLGRAAGSVRP
ncbi:YdbH domain-containing protein [Zavarzinia compransoris]|uniref:intermembrane phospholipid transport protein YdbH family protein n=1 Tax=Zavarzinia marina TaxID=2911065 RepID=UPI001F32BAFF|nr:YdbH domain-containing protein [Zavarzinia marina]MCF4164772.1 YdbH domain-containing protein [Zavarzinia marina]